MPQDVLDTVVPAITEIVYPFGNEKPFYKIKILVLFWSIWCIAIFWNAQHPTTDTPSADAMANMMKTSSNIDLICLAMVAIGFTARCLIVLNLAHVLLLLASDTCIRVILRTRYDYAKQQIVPVPFSKKSVRKDVGYIRWLCRRVNWTWGRLEELYPLTHDLALSIGEYTGFEAYFGRPKLVKAYDREPRTWWWTVTELQDGQPIPTSIDLTELNR